MRYETISGQSIDVPAQADVDAFLRQLQNMLDDPKATEDQMIALAYSRANPMLDHSMFPERGAVTREVLENPAYQVLTDLLTRKRIAQDGVDVAQLAARYTLSVPEAAARAGVHENAVRAAIKSRRLPAWVKDGKYFLNPISIDSWQVGTRGPPPPVPRPSGTAVGGPLEVRMGNAKGKSFRVKYPGALEGETRIDDHVIGGRIPTWRRVAVVSGGEGKHRMLILEPDDEDNELLFAGFSIRGRFRIVEKINNAREAREMFAAFRAA